MPLKFIPTNVKYNDSGEFKNISIPADRAYMNEAITVSSTQPTSSDNKLWINTNEQTKQTYQIPTMADMANYRTAAAQDAIDAAQDDNIEALAGSLATIETSPATAAHAVGEYIVYNGQLYKVTAAIAPGVTLTVGTNISAVSGGGLNDIHDILNIHTFGAADITELRSGISFYNNIASGYVIGRLCVFYCIINSSSADIPAYTNLFRLPYHPKSETNFLVMNSNVFPTAIGFIKDTGYVQMRSAITANNYIPIFTTVFSI